MAERPWGFWTESKLDMLSAYLPAFTTASKKAPSTVYLDLFAGQATNVSRDTGIPIEGSLLRAVQTTPPFTILHGFELRHKRARSGVNDSLDPGDLERAEQQVTDLFGSTEWRAILDGRQSGALDAERTRDELTNLMRWRLEKTLGYGFTHTLRLTNVYGVPLYDMIFATDHQVGHTIMKSVYSKAAERFPKMREDARARRRDRKEREAGSDALFRNEELVRDAPLRASESYQHTPPGSSLRPDHPGPRPVTFYADPPRARPSPRARIRKP